jgi:Ca2+-binding RTX toxin-like protein
LPTIIPALPGPWPTTVTTTASIVVNADYTVNAGTVLFADGLPDMPGTRTLFTIANFAATLTNNGEAWVRDSNDIGFRWAAPGGTTINNGLVVVESTAGRAFGLYDNQDVASGTHSLINTGQLYVFGQTYAVGLAGRSNSGTYQNSGLIAVRSVGGEAIGFEFGDSYDNTASNSASGQILVEGVSAIGVDIHNTETFDNQGIITAQTIADPVSGQVEFYSIGIAGYIFPGGIGQTLTINNSGTITADIAVLAYSITGYNQLDNNAVVNNLAGGTLNGAVILEFSDDELINAGTINGFVDMREGADLLDTGAGTITGLIDMGFGNDIFLGSAGADVVLGNRNDDTLDGAGGSDLLLGGSGADLLEGGTGNDGLYGEYENDTIVTLGGDVVSGGDGDDRIEAGDYAFRAVDGGGGLDTLVLPFGARVVDWSAVLASGRVTGIEAVILRGDQELALGATDVAGQFRVISTAGDTIDLIGAWSEAAATVIGAITYRTFALGGDQVLVAGGGTVVTGGAVPGGALGLDVIAGGKAPPLPGSVPGSELSGDIWLARDYDIGDDLVIDPSETWINDPGAPLGVRNNLFTIYDELTIVNNGTLLASASGSLRAVDIGVLTSFTNNGTFAVTQTGAGVVEAIAIEQHGTVHNTGIIDVAADGSASAIASFGGDRLIVVNPVETLRVPALENHGAISLISRDSIAYGAQLINGATVINSGTIAAQGATWAIGLAIGASFRSLNNSGTITATTEPGATGEARGVVVGTLQGNGLYTPEIVNSGVIEAATAIHVTGQRISFPPPMVNPPPPAFTVTNSNRITGAVILIDTTDTVTNHGLIDGSVSLGFGHDLFDSRGGTLTGTVSGGEGDDTFLVDGQATVIAENAGEGSDTVIAGGNFYLTAHIENLELASTAGGIFGVGNELGNSITGNAAGNLLLGGAGGDTVHGGAGVDQLFGEAGFDFLHGDAGIDYLVGGSEDDALYGGDDADALYGEDGNDTLVGGNSFDTDILVGGAGEDWLYGISGQANPDYDLMDGGAGDDAYYVDTGADLTFEAIGGGIDTVHADVGVANAGVYLYSNVENLVLEGTTAFGVGNELDNTLTGSASANWLLGGLGADRISGGAGNDVLFGEGGADTFVFGAGSGADLIGDFAIAQDVIEFASYFTSFAQVQANMVQVGANGAIDLGGGNLVVLNGMTMANLTAANFAFVSAAEPPKAAPGFDAVAAPVFRDHGPELWHFDLHAGTVLA